MDLVRALLLEVDKGGVAGNPFITDETETAQNEMYRFIFNDSEPHTRAQLDAESAFLRAICAEREQAFRMGFKTALELFFSGGGYDKHPLCLQAITGQK